jgi:hypothetical protein
MIFASSITSPVTGASEDEEDAGAEVTEVTRLEDAEETTDEVFLLLPCEHPAKIRAAAKVTEKRFIFIHSFLK